MAVHRRAACEALPRSFACLRVGPLSGRAGARRPGRSGDAPAPPSPGSSARSRPEATRERRRAPRLGVRGLAATGTTGPRPGGGCCLRSLITTMVTTVIAARGRSPSESRSDGATTVPPDRGEGGDRRRADSARIASASKRGRRPSVPAVRTALPARLPASGGPCAAQPARARAGRAGGQWRAGPAGRGAGFAPLLPLDGLWPDPSPSAGPGGTPSPPSLGPAGARTQSGPRPPPKRVCSSRPGRGPGCPSRRGVLVRDRQPAPAAGRALGAISSEPIVGTAAAWKAQAPGPVRVGVHLGGGGQGCGGLGVAP